MAFSVSHLGGAEPTLDNLCDLERKELSSLSKTTAAAVAAAAAATVAVGKSVASKVQAYENAGSSPRAAKVFSRSAGNDASAAALQDDGSEDFMNSYISRTPKVRVVFVYDLNVFIKSFNNSEIPTHYDVFLHNVNAIITRFLASRVIVLQNVQNAQRVSIKSLEFDPNRALKSSHDRRTVRNTSLCVRI